jgi:hypothetical protein
MAETRIQQLAAAGVAHPLSPKATKVINGLSDEEFNSVLSIRRQVIAVVSKDEQEKYDECLSFIF